jgi:hypothetical protein
VIIIAALGGAAIAIPSWWLAAVVTVVMIFLGWGFGWHILRSHRSLIVGFVGAVTPFAGILIRYAID